MNKRLIQIRNDIRSRIRSRPHSYYKNLTTSQLVIKMSFVHIIQDVPNANSFKQFLHRGSSKIIVASRKK